MPSTTRSRSKLDLTSSQPAKHQLFSPPPTSSPTPSDTSPLDLAPQPPGPAPTPSPWIWQCHSCHITYRLGCTRRCLECNHEFCTVLEPAAQRSAKKRVGKRSGPCKSEFDYGEWHNFGAWRRTIVLNVKPGKQQQGRAWGRETDAESDSERMPWMKRRERLFVARKHDCWQHCDYPSECRHTLYTAMAEGRKTETSPIVEEWDGTSLSDNGAERSGDSKTSDDANNADFGEAAWPLSNDNTLSNPPVATTEQYTCAEMTLDDAENLTNPGVIEDEDGDDVSVEELRGRQERRSRLKLARLTGVEAFGSPNTPDVVSSSTRAESSSLQNIKSDRKIARATAKSARKARKSSRTAEADHGGETPFPILDLKMPGVSGIEHHHDLEGSEWSESASSGHNTPAPAPVAGDSGVDEWDSWSGSSISSSSPSVHTLSDEIYESDPCSVEFIEDVECVDACEIGSAVGHYGFACEEDRSPVKDADSFSEERDLVAIIKLRNAFMRGDI